MHWRKTNNTTTKCCIICLSSIYDLWFIWSLCYLSFFCAWLVVHLAIALSVFLLFTKWTTSHAQKKDR
jgi:hypothetical protein